MRFWKDELSVILLSQESWSYQQLNALRSQFGNLRVKTVDARGLVPVIRFSDSEQWLKPNEWATEHMFAIARQYQELHSRMVNLGCDPSNGSSNGATTQQSSSKDVNDLHAITSEAQAFWFQQFLKSVKLLKALADGETLTEAQCQYILTYDIESGKPLFKV